MGRIRKTVGNADPPEVDLKIQEEKQRIAQDIARALREAGYECCLGEDSTAQRLKSDH